MKRYLLFFLLLSYLGAPLHAQQYRPTTDNIANREQFARDRFGIFLHWGLYSMFGQGEWYMQNAGIDHREYAKSMNAFYPHAFDAEAWVKAIKASGARYITFTTRHHDGFSLWDTKQSDYNIMNTPYGRDVVKALAEACQRHGIALHLYYSHIDWTRDDYPTGWTGKNTGKDKKLENWTSYYNFMNRQLTELLTNYGPIRAIWFDGWWDHEKDASPFDWQLPGQYALIHRLQPACLVGNNHHQTPNEGEDIQLFERDVPGENKAGMSGQSISQLPLETCETMNGMWGYKVKDQNYKTPSQLIALLVRTAAKGANLLLNVGPQPDGQLPATALQRLEVMGEWMQRNGATLYDTQAGGLVQGEHVVSTRRGKEVYLHVLADSITHIDLPCTERVRHIRTWGAGETIKFVQKKGKLRFALEPQVDTPDRIYTITMK
ncbi:MAG: alpha-L-fucosidase [Bacteroidales bacterium]|nr:alpha-L-fucosidase [Bacteroidales bacterium]